MIEVEFRKLSFPKAMNLDILIDTLPEKELKTLLAQHCEQERKERRIILPRIQTLRKVLLHFFWKEIEAGRLSWAEVKNYFKERGTTLRAMNIDKREAQRLYHQREKEIKHENNGK